MSDYSSDLQGGVLPNAPKVEITPAVPPVPILPPARPTFTPLPQEPDLTTGSYSQQIPGRQNRLAITGGDDDSGKDT